MDKIFLVFFVTVFTHTSILSQNPTPFTSNKAFTFGEELNYSIRYSLYVNIPVAKLQFKIYNQPEKINDELHYHFYTAGETYKFYNNIYQIKDYYHSKVKISDFTTTKSYRNITEGKTHFIQNYSFYQNEKKLIDEEGKKYTIPYFTHDVISAIYLSRTFDYENASIGDSFMMNIFIDDTLFNLGVKYLGKETVKLKSGTYRCIKLSPILVVGRIFKSEEDMVLWVSDDKNKIPIKIYTGIRVGAITAVLEDYKGLRGDLNKIK